MSGIEIAGSVLGLVAGCMQVLETAHRFIREIRQNELHHEGIDQAKWQAEKTLLSLGSSSVAIPACVIIRSYTSGLTLRIASECESAKTLQMERSVVLSHAWLCDSGVHNIAAFRDRARTVIERLPAGLPESVRTPSPTAFFVASLSFALALAVYHQAHRSSDRLQNQFLACGAAVAVIAALAMREPAVFLLTVWLPWASIIAAFLSSALHQSARWASGGSKSRRSIKPTRQRAKGLAEVQEKSAILEDPEKQAVLT